MARRRFYEPICRSSGGTSRWLAEFPLNTDSSRSSPSVSLALSRDISSTAVLNSSSTKIFDILIFIDLKKSLVDINSDLPEAMKKRSLPRIGLSFEQSFRISSAFSLFFFCEKYNSPRLWKVKVTFGSVDLDWRSSIIGHSNYTARDLDRYRKKRWLSERVSSIGVFDTAINTEGARHATSIYYVERDSRALRKSGKLVIVGCPPRWWLGADFYFYFYQQKWLMLQSILLLYRAYIYKC